MAASAKAQGDSARRRLLRFLSQGEARLADSAARDRVLLDAGDRGTVSADRRQLAAMVREGILRTAGGRIALAAAQAGAAAASRDVGAVTIQTDDGPRTVVVNWSESPLSQLVRRKDRSGAPFLTAAEFQAGERLRADYTRGQIMPRLGANWVATVSSGRRDGGVAELTEAALAARIRVDKAIGAVGPELAGVLIDICCFLKGMETVEMERGWPVRSAKVVLKTALGALARHYDPATVPGRPRMLHWGATDYRPSIG
ncbi:DUF6456 domain-containing protein [Mesorhizobium sp. ZMM04-5]|uniref:DUF6456 domain-containing protein n=1 Tax=Mesorhizobium marinum TaxID=3228790 RepID=A0ABV3R0H9_9HYPH